jgi:hypothetical protein
MRHLLLLVAFTSAASAGPLARFGGVGGYDTSAPGHYDDGISIAVGYRFDRLSVVADYAYLDYDKSEGFGGGAQRYGAMLQTMLASAHCNPGVTCTHLDFDVGLGYRTVRWEPVQMGLIPTTDPVVDRQGRELRIGLSATFVPLNFGLHYVLFTPDAGPEVLCRGTCPMRTVGSSPGVMLDATFVVGD